MTPVCVLGAVRSFRKIGRPMSIYLVLFFITFIVCLAFYAFFSNRYIMPVLIPCLVWVAIGIERLGEQLTLRSRTGRTFFLVALILVAYGMFEISFQLVQSSRAMHVTRATLLRDLGDIVKDGDVVVTLPSMNESVVRLTPRQVEDVGVSSLTPEMLAQYAGRDVYVVWTPKQWASEGAASSLSVDAVRDRLVPVRTLKTPAVVELLLYRLLRRFGLERLIPAEEWVVFKVGPSR